MNALVFISGHAYSWRGLNAISCRGRMGTDICGYLLSGVSPKVPEKCEENRRVNAILWNGYR